MGGKQRGRLMGRDPTGKFEMGVVYGAEKGRTRKRWNGCQAGK
jgi:hypothetical protein